MSASSSVYSDSDPANTKRDSPTALLLHGYLHVQIIRAKRLRDFDCIYGCRTVAGLAGLACCGGTYSSDPYVTVHLGSYRLIKTSFKPNNLDPVWKEDFVLPVNHRVDCIEFRVKDLDPYRSADLMGKTFLPVHELVKFNGFNKTNGKPMPQRTGVHRMSYLDGKPRHGTLEYYVEYVPAALIPNNNPVAPGCYFSPQQQNDVKLYINADDSPHGTPVVQYGENKEKTWEPQRLWRNVYDSLCQAKHMIYVAGWAVDHTQSLLRGQEQKDAIEEGKYSPFIGDLLVQKANEGVTVNVMVWDDQTSNMIVKAGVMATKDEALKAFFVSTKVNCQLVPMVGGAVNTILEKIRNSVVFTHHQKLVVCDDAKSKLVGYVGGVDLTYGRWDNRNYPLFRTLASDHLNDFHSACMPFPNCETVGPRQPWHDIHLSVRGKAVLDIIQNFEERWREQAPREVGKLVDLKAKGIGCDEVGGSNKEAWSTQLFRSIDERTAKFDPKVQKGFKAPAFKEIQGVMFEKKPPRRQSSSKSLKLRRKVFDANDQVQDTFVADSVKGFDFSRTLHHSKSRDIDNSIHDALVYHIRRAKHCVYIESQYFLSSAHIWPESQATSCRNQVAAELTLKICQKIEDDERFAVYILLPMWPEGLPDSAAVQEILHWQRLSMEGMYINIADAIRKKKQSDAQFDALPTDYLNFYCLANRETQDGSESQGVPPPNSLGEVLNQTRRHLIYVHSKMTIVDDEVAIIGSANINQRSLDGTRDSEILQASWQPAYAATETSVALGDVHGFRLHCWAHTTGTMDDVFRNPSSRECVHRVNAIATQNWNLYAQQKVCEMDSYLVSYPVTVSNDGKIQASTADGCFPDTTASILGAKSKIPALVTT